MAGSVPQVSKLYPTVPFPVSRGTPSISPLVNWEHTENWHILDEVTVVSNFCESYREKERRKLGKFLLPYVKNNTYFFDKVKLCKFWGFHHSC
jgi:fatty acid synthase